MIGIKVEDLIKNLQDIKEETVTAVGTFSDAKGTGMILYSGKFGDTELKRIYYHDIKE